MVALLGLAAALTGCRDQSPPTVSPAGPGGANAPSAYGALEPPVAEPSQPSADPSLFQQIHGGLQFVYRNGEDAGHCSILESLGGGVGVLDYDRDGHLDLCLPGGGTFGSQQEILGLPTALYQNHGEWSFRNRASESYLAPASTYTHGVAVADFNDDGFPDAAITGYGGLRLWTNQGDGTFVDATRQLGITTDAWASSAAWGDLNSDGLLDLYVTHYVDWSFANHPLCRAAGGERDICPPKSFAALPDAVYYSQPGGRFADCSREAGLRDDGKGLGVVLLDVDHDGDLDIYVANDTTQNFLYLNQGDGVLREVGQLHGVALDDRGIPNGSMGVDGLDYNGDARLDLWVANYEDETFALYRNEGDAYFLHVSRPAGVTSLGQRFVGFGTVAADYDLDGDEDLVVVNGHVIKFPTQAPRRQLPLYLENRQGRFYRAAFAADDYFATAHEGRGLAAGDLDRDGRVDLVVSHLNEPAALLRNQSKAGRSFAVRLIGRASNRDAIGAVLTLETSVGAYLRQIKGGGSYLSSSDLQVHWGLAEGEMPLALQIRWPSGRSQRIEPVELDRLVVHEP